MAFAGLLGIHANHRGFERDPAIGPCLLGDSQFDGKQRVFGDMGGGRKQEAAEADVFGDDGKDGDVSDRLTAKRRFDPGVFSPFDTHRV